MYISGYLSGVNRWVPDNVDVTGGAGVVAAIDWIRNYCSTYTASSVGIAIEEFIIASWPERVRFGPNAR